MSRVNGKYSTPDRWVIEGGVLLFAPRLRIAGAGAGFCGVWLYHLHVHFAWRWLSEMEESLYSGLDG